MPKPGYIYDSVSKKNICTFPNCKTCDENDGSICKYCIDVYKFDEVENKCNCNVLNCNICNS